MRGRGVAGCYVAWGVALSGATLLLGRRVVIPSVLHNEGTVPSSGVALSLGAALRGVAALLGATLSLGRRGAIPSASHDKGTVPTSGVAL